ncbi:MAG: adenosylcobinamide-GDP ribazoletransferase [Bryobacteraceae bacterium]
MRSALQFLTVLPVTTRSPGYGAVWFPFVGCLLGLAAATALRLPQGSICALLLVTALTGGLHEDGLADVCDAVRAYRSREKMMEILHDSRIGAHGALALVFSVLLRWQALEHLTGNPWLRLPATLAISRGTMVLLAAFTPTAGSGVGRSFQESLSKSTVWLTAIQVVALAFSAGWHAAAYLIPLQLAIVLASRRWFVTRLGGVSGDCLGFQCQVSEAASLLLFTWV